MYHPQIYTPNSEKSIVKITASSVNNAMTANKQIHIDSTNFSHKNITMSSGRFIVSGGEHLFLASPEAGISPISSTTQSSFIFQWYDVTNSQFIGVAGRRVVQATAGTVNLPRVPLASCYVDSAITLELRCVSQAGGTIDGWRSYAQTIVGHSWVAIYTSL